MTKTKADKEEDRRHSGVEQSGSSLSADDYPRVMKTKADVFLKKKTYAL